MQAQDAVAGIGTTVSATGLPPGSAWEAVLSAPTGQRWSLPLQADRNGEGQIAIPGGYVQKAGLYQVILRDGTETNPAATATFEVLPDSIDADASTLTSDRESISPDGRDGASISVTVRDAHGNPLPGRPMQVISSVVGDEVTPETTETDGNGEQRFTLTAAEPGIRYLRAMDLLTSTVIAARVTIDAGGNAIEDVGTWSPYAAQLTNATTLAQANAVSIPTGFEIALDPKSPSVNQAADITIRAVGGKNLDTVKNYVGTALIHSPTDANVTLPGIVETRPPDLQGRNVGKVTYTKTLQGVKFIPRAVVFRKSGRQTLVIEDRTDPQHVIRGQIDVTVASAAPDGSAPAIVIISPPAETSLNAPRVAITGVGPQNADLLVTGGAQPAKTDTDGEGRFSTMVDLTPGQAEITVTVSDESGQYRPASVRVLLDADKPRISDVTFSPEKPEEGQNTLVSVSAEPKLKDVRIQIGDRDIPLPMNENSQTTYQAFFKAPAAGTYDATVRATDGAGNTTQIRQPFTVVSKGLPKVTGVSAKAIARGVELQWQASTADTITGYRIYVGDAPGEFSSNLDAGKTATSAAIKGLKSGTTYSFAITAVEGKRESEKSDVVTAMPLGLALTVTPKDADLLLEWVFPTDTPLQSFLLEYGAQRDQYTEKRLLNGTLRRMTLHDLLPGVTYYLQLTPIVSEGTLLRELAAQAEATTLTGHTTITQGDTVPLNTTQPPLHGGAPENFPSGLPSGAWWLLALAAGVGGLLSWNKRKRMRTAAAFLAAVEKRYHT